MAFCKVLLACALLLFWTSDSMKAIPAANPCAGIRVVYIHSPGLPPVKKKHLDSCQYDMRIRDLAWA